MQKQFLKIFFISLFVILSCNIFAQGLMNQRDQAFKEYRTFKDTMSIRTWINMVELSNRLEKVVLLDNSLLDSVLIGRPSDANLEARIQELSKIREQLIADNARLNQLNIDRTKQSKLYYSLFIVSIVLLVIILSLFVYQFNKFRSIKNNTDTNSENTLKLKHFYNKEITKLKSELVNIQDEKVLIENNALQIRKSFETLKVEKSDLEKKVADAQETKDLEEIRKTMEEMSLEVSKIMEEKRDLELDLSKAKHDLSNQIEINKEIEADLEKIFNRFKKD